MPVPMHDPPHPDGFIRRRCLQPLGLTATEAAGGPTVSRNTSSMLLNGHPGISPEMAIRLPEALGGSPESWLTRQQQFDLRYGQSGRAPAEVGRFTAVSANLTGAACIGECRCNSRRKAGSGRSRCPERQVRRARPRTSPGKRAGSHRGHSRTNLGSVSSWLHPSAGHGSCNSQDACP